MFRPRPGRKKVWGIGEPLPPDLVPLPPDSVSEDIDQQPNGTVEERSEDLVPVTSESSAPVTTESPVPVATGSPGRSGKRKAEAEPDSG